MDFEWTYDIEDIPIGSIIRAQGLLFRTTRIKHTKSNGEDFKYGRINLDGWRNDGYYKIFYLRILKIHDNCIECQTFSYEDGDYHTPIFIDPTEARNRFFKGI